jgi:hypothetical protein
MPLGPARPQDAVLLAEVPDRGGLAAVEPPGEREGEEVERARGERDRAGTERDPGWPE